jgi:hypothetical protein
MRGEEKEEEVSRSAIEGDGRARKVEVGDRGKWREGKRDDEAGNAGRRENGQRRRGMGRGREVRRATIQGEGKERER